MDDHPGWMKAIFPGFRTRCELPPCLTWQLLVFKPGIWPKKFDPRPDPEPDQGTRGVRASCPPPGSLPETAAPQDPRAFTARSRLVRSRLTRYPLARSPLPDLPWDFLPGFSLGICPGLPPWHGVALRFPGKNLRPPRRLARPDPAVDTGSHFSQCLGQPHTGIARPKAREKQRFAVCSGSALFCGKSRP